MLPIILSIVVLSAGLAILFQKKGIMKKKFGRDKFSAKDAKDKVISTANFFVFLLYPGLMLRWVKLMKFTPLYIDNDGDGVPEPMV